MIIARLLVSLLFICALTGAALAAEVAVSTNSADQVNPDVSGNYIAWEDHRGDFSRIYLYAIPSGKVTIIPPPTPSSNQYQPAICGDSVVFVSHSKTGYEVRLYSIESGTSTPIRSSTELLEEPDVHETSTGVTVVWTEYVQNDPYGAANNDIWLQSRPKGIGFTQTRCLSDGGYETSPRISGTDVVWMHKTEVPGLDSYHGPYDVYRATTSGSAPELVSTSTAGDRNMGPDVSGANVVWQDSDEIDDYGAQVLLSALPPPASGPTVFRPLLSDTPPASWAYRDPAISGTTIVYLEGDLGASPATSRLKVAEVGSATSVFLTSSTTTFNPCIDGKTVVWQDRRAGNYDIYMATMTPTPISGCTAITEPGWYTLEADIVESSCPVAIDIQCSDVYLDGQGHLVDGRDLPGTNGILVRDFEIIMGEEVLVLSTNVQIGDIHLTDWGTGVQALGSDNLSLSGVSASSGVDGIVLDPLCGDGALTSCSITDNSGDGLWVADNSGASITNCTIARNGGHGAFLFTSGIDVRDSMIAENGRDGINLDRAGLLLHNSTVRDNGESGINLYNVVSAVCMIEGTTITGNAIGISDLNIYGGGRVIYNNIFNNTLNVVSVAVSQYNTMVAPGPNIIGGPFIGGNFYAQPNGQGFSETHADSNGDGFCDEEYVINDGTEFLNDPVIDHLPLHRPGTVPTVAPMIVVQAEDYLAGGEGVGYHDTTAGNSGGDPYRQDDVDIAPLGTKGHVVTRIAEGEWTRYQVWIDATGNVNYPLGLRLAGWADGQTITVAVAGMTGSVDVPVPMTGSTTTYGYGNASIRLKPGLNTIQFTYHGSAMNFDSFTLDPAAISPAKVVPGGSASPTDTNYDGKYDDVNGNGRKDFADVVLYFNQMSWIAANEPVALFDYNGNGRIDFADVVWLFDQL